MSPEKQIQTLREEIRRHDHAYYTLAKPAISDQKYDQLLRELIELENAHPEFFDPNSPSQRVGAQAIDKFKSMEHRVPMMSIDNTYDEGDFRAFDHRVREMLDVATVIYTTEPKVDGVACSLRYEKGELIYALTRGDGKRGDDITHNVRTIRTVPMHLQGKPPPVLEVRGEVFMENSTFQKINLERAEKGEETFANPRNFTAGTLKQLDPTNARERNLKFAAHGFGEVVGFDDDSYFDRLNSLKQFGIPLNEHVARVNGVEEAWKAIEDFA
ncbi:MAG TPA: hypothetical protein PK402_07765, partial [Tepidisphaeraceae bacterium]|nr:hypothetical protein [Tepidisphaeraceae bacterium]